MKLLLDHGGTADIIARLQNARGARSRVRITSGVLIAFARVSIGKPVSLKQHGAGARVRSRWCPRSELTLNRILV